METDTVDTEKMETETTTNTETAEEMASKNENSNAANEIVSDTSADQDKLTMEGKAEVYLPSSVFYNPVQEFNRDLTIAIISLFAEEYIANGANTSKGARIKEDTSENTSESAPLDLKPLVKYDNGVRILEGLAASGLRSVRFALEIPGVREIVTNDFDQTAVEFIKKNASHNKVEHLITPSLADAAQLMYTHKTGSNRFNVIDLDPYGSPSKFLDSTVQAVSDGGLLCITCTDMAILCGNGAETCYAKYGAMSLKAKFCHEMALRIVLQSIESAANRYSRYIRPLLSLSVDFYCRVFVQVFTSQKEVKKSVSKMSMVYHCTSCGDHHLQPLATVTPTGINNFKYGPAIGPPVGEKCKHCGGSFHIGGPIWNAPLHNKSFVNKVIDMVKSSPGRFGTEKRLLGVLSMVQEELEDAPLYFVLDDMCNRVHCTSPGLAKFRSAILNAGYQVTASHCAKNSIKTTASGSVLWDIMRAFVKENPIHKSRMKEGTTTYKLLQVSPTIEVDFTPHPDANPKSRQDKLVRWQMNPLPNWGPQARATKGKVESLEEKRQKGMLKAKSKKRPIVDPTSFKQYICKKYKAGECEFGESCKYSHDMTATGNGQDQHESTS